MWRMRMRRAMQLSIGARRRNGIPGPVKPLLREEKRKSLKQKVKPQKLKRNSHSFRKIRLSCNPNWTLIRTRSVPCKSESKKPRKRPNLRQVQSPPAHHRNYRRNSRMHATNLIVRKKRKPSYPKNFKPPRSARLNSSKRKSAEKLPPGEQVCAARSLPSIRRTILWS